MAQLQPTLVLTRKAGEPFGNDPAGVSKVLDDSNPNLVRIVYPSSDKQYSYKRENVAVLSLAQAVDPSQAVIRHGNTILKNVQLCGFYTSNHPAKENLCLIQFENGKSRFLKTKDVSVHSRGNDSFLLYLREVCDQTEEEIPYPDGRRGKYLRDQYDALGTFAASSAACFSDAVKEPIGQFSDNLPVIYPFGANLSQMAAVDNALQNQLSIIEGPPGTGKTQTILNIIANLIIRKKTILITSPNVSATDNVTEKLQKEGLGFLVARLGRRDMRDEFIANQPPYPPDLAQWALPASEMEVLSQALLANREQISKVFERQRRFAELRTELDGWKLQQSHFQKGYSHVVPVTLKPRTTIERVESARDMIRFCADSGRKPTMLDKLRTIWLWGVGKWRDYARPLVELEVSLNDAYFRMMIARLEQQIGELKAALANVNADQLISAFRQQSMAYLKSTIGIKYRDHVSSRPMFGSDDLWKNASAFRQEYPIVTSTTNAARKQVHGQLFDYVIIDESSQASLTTGMLALSSAANAVVVGDTKQLPFVLGDGERKVIEAIDVAWKIPAHMSCAKQSLLSAITVHPQLNAPRQLLREHYRCHPSIIGFCNQAFYDSQLVVMTAKEGAPSCAMAAITTKDLNYDRAHDYNRVQAEVFYSDVFAPLMAKGFAHDDLGVASPYRAQVDGMKRDGRFAGIEIDTVHKYQGREKRSMAFVTEKNDITDFLNDPNLLNVAVSRAVDEFFLVASPRVVAGQNNIASLYQYIVYQGGGVCESNVSSSFDLIYPSLTEERLSFLAKHGYASDETYSEAQAEQYVIQALRRLGLSGQIDYRRNYPLLQFITNLDLFGDRERAFILNQAHADFLFFRVSDKAVLFDIEVNGSQHATGVQAERDELKRAIFHKLGLGLETIWTHEANVQEKIERLLSQYYKREELKATKPVKTNDAEHPWLA